MKALRAIIDTWTLIEKYGISFETDGSTIVLISDEDYEMLLVAAKNKNYVRSLISKSEYAIRHYGN